jgi:glycosyltransferase 2 family protein
MALRLAADAEERVMSTGRAVAIRRVLVAMLLAVAVYGGFAVWRGLGKMGDELARFQWWAFGAACALAFGNYLVRWLKWEFYLARLEIKGVGRLDSLLTFLSGFVLTVTPGKVGEVFKSLVLFETYGVPVARTAPIVVAERVTDVIGVVVLIVIGSLGFSGGLLWAGLGMAAVVVLLVVVSSRGLSTAIIGILERLPGPFRRIGPKLHEAYDSLATLVRPANLIVPTVLSIGAWSLECTALWVILKGFAQDTGIGLATFFYATSTLAGALVPVPGGLGVTETSLQQQLQDLGHVGATTATAAMILVRFATLWFAVLVGFVSLSLLKRRHAGLLAGGGDAPKSGAGVEAAG